MLPPPQPLYTEVSGIAPPFGKVELVTVNVAGVCV
jgi:hypothetical protein